MASWDYVEWYNRQQVWLQVLLFPIVVSGMLLHSTIGIAIFLAVLPFLLLEGWMDQRRFWRRLREQGRVGQWKEAWPQVSRGSGTLVVEVTPKGPGCSWLIDLPREQIDPENVVPSWQQFEEQGWGAFELCAAAYESLNRWTVERLVAYEASARALAPSWQQLATLDVAAKRRSVLAVHCGLKGCLSRRCT